MGSRNNIYCTNLWPADCSTDGFQVPLVFQCSTNDALNYEATFEKFK